MPLGGSQAEGGAGEDCPPAKGTPSPTCGNGTTNPIRVSCPYDDVGAAVVGKAPGSDGSGAGGDGTLSQSDSVTEDDGAGGESMAAQDGSLDGSQACSQ